MPPFSLDIEQINNSETQSPPDILAWSWETFRPHVVVSTSFQTQSVALLHMVSQVCPEMPVIFVDTGYHFPETLAFRDELQRQLDLNVQTVHPDPEIRQRRANAAGPLYVRDPDLCCRIHRVEPMACALAGIEAWVSGVRRDQTHHRQKIQVVSRRDDGLIRIHPLANWTKRDLEVYIDRHALPMHPLSSQGYTSIGCAPCTRPPSDGEDERSGRWAGTDKTECGLHTMTIPGPAVSSSSDEK